MLCQSLISCSLEDANNRPKTVEDSKDALGISTSRATQLKVTFQDTIFTSVYVNLLAAPDVPAKGIDARSDVNGNITLAVSTLNTLQVSLPPRMDQTCSLTIN